MKEQAGHKEIASTDGIVALEDLPLPRVLYPGFYGAFFGFQSKESDPVFLCSCAKEAIRNYIRFRLARPRLLNRYPTRAFILDSMHFPISLVESLMKLQVLYKYKEDQVMDYLEFKNRLCHECQRATPSYLYCHAMYGSKFKQQFGWYINKAGFELGVEPITCYILPDACPKQILELIKLDPRETPVRYSELNKAGRLEEAHALNRAFSKQERDVWRIVENSVRERFLGTSSGQR